MKNLHIVDSYKTWTIASMKEQIDFVSNYMYDLDAAVVLNRTYKDMYIEWYLHNLGYYVSKPLCFLKYFKNINLRCKDVDLEELNKKPRV